jgi:hypothetical protein
MPPRDLKSIISFFNPESYRLSLPEAMASTPASAILPDGVNASDPNVSVDSKEAVWPFSGGITLQMRTDWSAPVDCDTALRTAVQLLLELPARPPAAGYPPTRWASDMAGLIQKLQSMLPLRLPYRSQSFLSQLVGSALLKDTATVVFLKKALDGCSGAGPLTTYNDMAQVLLRIAQVPGLMAQYACAEGGDPAKLFDSSGNGWDAVAKYPIDFSNPLGVPCYAGPSNSKVNPIYYPASLVSQLGEYKSFTVSYIVQPTGETWYHPCSAIASPAFPLSPMMPVGFSDVTVGVDTSSNIMSFNFMDVASYDEKPRVYEYSQWEVDITDLVGPSWFAATCTFAAPLDPQDPNDVGVLSVYYNGVQVDPSLVTNDSVPNPPVLPITSTESLGFEVHPHTPLPPGQEPLNLGLFSLIRFYDHALTPGEAALDYLSMKIFAQQRGISLP